MDAVTSVDFNRVSTIQKRRYACHNKEATIFKRMDSLLAVRIARRWQFGTTPSIFTYRNGLTNPLLALNFIQEAHPLLSMPPSLTVVYQFLTGGPGSALTITGTERQNWITIPHCPSAAANTEHACCYLVTIQQSGWITRWTGRSGKPGRTRIAPSGNRQGCS
jgi:hypothetical protein